MAHDQLTDDSPIADEAHLWRRVPSWRFIFDANLGRVRASNAAFDDDADGSPMSVVLAEAVLESGRGPEHILAGHDRFALAAITAGLARSKQQGIARDPVLEESAHALVFGNKTDSVKRALVKGADWIVSPLDVAHS